MKQLGLALHNYHDVFLTFPYRVGGGLNSSDGNPNPGNFAKYDYEGAGFFMNMSGLGLLLPYIDQAPRYNSIAALPPSSAAWDGNPLYTQDIVGFLCPSDLKSAGPGGRNNYRFSAGDFGKRHRRSPDALAWGGEQPIRGIFGACTNTKISDILDGTSNTVMMSERCQSTDRRNEVISGLAKVTMDDGFIDSVNAATAGDLDKVANLCLGGVANNVYTNPWTNEVCGSRWIDGGYFYVGFSTTLPPNSASCRSSSGDDRDHALITASSRHTGIVHALLADGSVKGVSNNIDTGIWRAVGTKANGETIGEW